MKFLWSDKEFSLAEENVISRSTVLVPDTEIMQKELRAAFEAHHAVLVDRFIIDEDELTHNTYICAELRFSLQFGEDEEARADAILLTRQERRLLGLEDLPEYPECLHIPYVFY